MDDVSKTLLICAIVVLLLAILNMCMYKNTKFDNIIVEIEQLLNSEYPRRHKYVLFSLLDQAAEYCNSYSELEKLQKLLLKVYDL